MQAQIRSGEQELTVEPNCVSYRTGHVHSPLYSSQQPMKERHLPPLNRITEEGGEAIWSTNTIDSQEEAGI